MMHALVGDAYVFFTSLIVKDVNKLCANKGIEFDRMVVSLHSVLQRCRLHVVHGLPFVHTVRRLYLIDGGLVYSHR